MLIIYLTINFFVPNPLSSLCLVNQSVQAFVIVITGWICIRHHSSWHQIVPIVPWSRLGRGCWVMVTGRRQEWSSKWVGESSVGFQRGWSSESGLQRRMASGTYRWRYCKADTREVNRRDIRTPGAGFASQLHVATVVSDTASSMELTCWLD